VHLTNQLNRLQKKLDALKNNCRNEQEIKALETLTEDIKGFIYGKT
jgi:hypothetical protein